MKKLFTLVALLAVFMGAKAVNWDEVKKIDYKGLTDFPYYIMGYAPDIVNGIMVDDPVPYRKLWRGNENDFPGEDACEGQVTINGGSFYLQKLESNPWRQYFVADGVATDVGTNYKVVARVKSSQDCTVHVNMGDWSKALGADVLFPASDDFQDVEWTYDEIPVSSCFIIAQPGVTDAVIEWESITVYKQRKEGGRPQVWLQDITNGDAEKSWVEMQLDDVQYNDNTKNFLVCAWSKERLRNMNEEGTGWNPFPSDIEVDPKDPNNHVYVCHGQPAITEGDAAAWDNQFWIQSPKMLKVGSQFKLHFRYKASEAATTNTQFHHQNPSDYVFYQAIGDINFTTEWQEYDGVVTVPEQATDAWSIAFNLNPQNKNAVNFYFDDLSLSLMKLDEGYFVASSNTATGIEYDFDNATEFTVDDDLIVATVGTKGKQDTWVNEVMISTVRGNDRAFKSSTLKPTGTVVNDPDTWLDYTEGSNAKIKLPAAGVWTISIDTEGKQMNFVKLEGEKDQEPLDIKPNTSVVVVHGQERDDLADTDTEVREEEGGTGQPWDNQFFILANRTLEAGEVTVLEFDYQSTIEAKTTTQCHGAPGAYMHWNCIGDVNFTPEMTHFRTTFTVPSEANGMQSIAFNMAEIKAACDYTITNVVWKLEDNTETLINETGVENFIVKEGAGTEPHVYVDPTGINNAVVGNTVSTAAYNLAGQRVSNSYKGIVVKNGKKFIVK